VRPSLLEPSPPSHPSLPLWAVVAALLDWQEVRPPPLPSLSCGGRTPWGSGWRQNKVLIHRTPVLC
jgi:hypothetical protein